MSLQPSVSAIKAPSLGVGSVCVDLIAQFLKFSQKHSLGTVNVSENTDASAAPGWLSAERPFPFFLQRLNALGTELRSLLNPVCAAAPGWLSARARDNFSENQSADSEDSLPHYHISVLPQEVMDALEPGEDKYIVDGTLGGGGHTEMLLNAGSRVLGVDRDPEALAHATARLSKFGERFSTFHGNFTEIPIHPGIASGELADGLLLDLGVSSRQLDVAERGFSFMRTGPLDMRMGPNATMTAAELVNTTAEEDLAHILYTYGEEPRSRRIASAIVRQREVAPFTTTTELAECIEKAIGRKGRTHPATKSFQAIRMAINEELESLSEVLHSIEKILKPGGKVAIITFHSLEDRMVKRFFKHHSQKTIDDPTWPEARPNPDLKFRLLSRRAIAPQAEELSKNPRSRSAKLRIAQLLEA